MIFKHVVSTCVSQVSMITDTGDNHLSKKKKAILTHSFRSSSPWQVGLVLGSVVRY